MTSSLDHVSVPGFPPISWHPEHPDPLTASQANDAGILRFDTLGLRPDDFAVASPDTVAGHLGNHQWHARISTPRSPEAVISDLITMQCVVAVQIDEAPWFVVLDRTDVERVRCGTVVTESLADQSSRQVQQEMVRDQQAAHSPVDRALRMVSGGRPPVTGMVAFTREAACPVELSSQLRTVEDAAKKHAASHPAIREALNNLDAAVGRHRDAHDFPETHCLDVCVDALITAEVISRVHIEGTGHWFYAHLGAPGGPKAVVAERVMNTLAEHLDEILHGHEEYRTTLAAEW